MSSSSPLSGTMHRLALPAFIFAAVLLCGVLLLSYLFDPGRYPVHVGSEVFRLEELAQEHRDLAVRRDQIDAQVASLEELVPTPTLDALADLRRDRLPAFDALIAIANARESFTLASGNPIIVGRMTLRQDGTIELSGAVRDQAGRTMQLLASFVDRLREQEVLTSVSEPEYTEYVDTDGMPTSPFTLSIRFGDA